MDRTLANFFTERLATLVPSRVHHGRQEYKFVILDESVMDFSIDVGYGRRLLCRELHGRELVWMNGKRPNPRNACVHWITALEARRYSSMEDTAGSCFTWNGRYYPSWLAWESPENGVGFAVPWRRE